LRCRLVSRPSSRTGRERLRALRHGGRRSGVGSSPTVRPELVLGEEPLRSGAIPVAPGAPAGRRARRGRRRSPGIRRALVLGDIPGEGGRGPRDTPLFGGGGGARSQSEPTVRLLL